MRKYFLLSAVALMISGTANATDYVQFQASANVSFAKKIECTQNLNFGDIVLDNQYTAERWVDVDSYDIGVTRMSEGVVSVSGAHHAICNADLSDLIGTTVQLIHTEDPSIMFNARLSVESYDTYSYIGGKLDIYDLDSYYIEAGEYVGTITYILPIE